MVAIFVVLTIVAFVLVDAMVQRSEARKKEAVSQPSLGRSIKLEWSPDSSIVPGGVYLDKGHTWVALESSGNAKVGMDDFAQSAIGRIDGVELPPIGQDTRRGEKLFTICQGKRKLEFSSPIDGVIVSVNESLVQETEPLKEDPFQRGWVCAFRPKDLARNLRRLSVAEEATAWLKLEIQRFREFVTTRPIEHMTLTWAGPTASGTHW